MEQKNIGSIATKFLSFLFFVILTIASLGWFTVSSYGTLHSLFNGEDIVWFSKGAMYSLGAGIVLLLLTLLGLYQNVKKVDLSKVQTVLVTRIFILVTISMFFFPIAAHLSINKLTSQNGYFECMEMNYKWFLYEKIVYVNSQAVCEDLTNSREITKSSSGR